MIDLVAAKRLMLRGAADLDVSTRRTIAQAVGPKARQDGNAPRQGAGKC